MKTTLDDSSYAYTDSWWNPHFFDPAINKDFKLQFDSAALSNVRVVLGILIVFWCGFIWFDLFLSPAAKSRVLEFRFAVITPLFLLLGAISFSKVAASLYQSLIVFIEFLTFAALIRVVALYDDFGFVASRIESYTVGGQILISESVRQEVGEILRIDTQRDVLPKGAETPLRIYEVGGIGGRFNLALEEKGKTPVALTRRIQLGITVLEDKDVVKKELKGVIAQLSKNCAEITLGTSVEVMTNLKMNLADVDEKLSARNFYGKVIERSGEEDQIHLVHFTSVPPEVDAYFQAHMQYAKG